MKISIETGVYNERRYGKPWIAKVDFSDGKGIFQWGNWIGDHYNGGEGVLEIDANPQDIIATGQKDFRKPRKSAPDYYEVMPDGKLTYIGDKGKAYKRWKEIKAGGAK